MSGMHGSTSTESDEPRHDAVDSESPDAMWRREQESAERRSPGPDAASPEGDGIPRFETEPIEGGITYDSEALRQVYNFLNSKFESHIALIESGAQALEPRSGGFHDAFQVNNIVLGVRSTHVGNADSLRQIYSTFLDGLRTVIQRYDRSSEEQDDLVADLNGIVESNSQTSMLNFTPRSPDAPIV